MTENMTESVLSLSLVTEQECQRRVEQARQRGYGAGFVDGQDAESKWRNICLKCWERVKEGPGGPLRMTDVGLCQQHYEEKLEQAQDEEQRRIEHIIQHRINAMPTPPDDNKPSVFRTIRVELQRVLADIRGAGKETDDGMD